MLWFKAYPCVTITPPKESYLSIGRIGMDITLPQIYQGDYDDWHIPSAERIYLGRENIKKALAEDPVAKYLLSPINFIKID
jgi:hypothetical protein